MKSFRRWIAMALVLSVLCAGLPFLAAGEETRPAVLRTDHSPIMNGYGDGKFGPSDPLTWAQVCMIIYNSLADQSMGTVEGSFSDVTPDKWYYTPVMTLVSRGYLPAHGGVLCANEMITRRDFVRLIVGLEGVDESAECGFTDVPENDWDYRAIATAVDRGWIRGTDTGRFQPDRSLSRAEAAAVFGRMMGRSADPELLASAKDLRVFDDVPRTAWYYSAVMEATVNHRAVTAENGGEHWIGYTPSWPVTWKTDSETVTELVYTGERPCHAPKSVVHWVTPEGGAADPENTPVTRAAVYVELRAPALKKDHSPFISGIGDGRFDPKGSITRAQAAQILYNLLAKTDRGSFKAEFTDVPRNKWYYTAVITLTSLGLFENTGKFRPTEPMTRGELADLLARFTPYVRGGTPFRDVPAEHPYSLAIAAVAAKGWVRGYSDGTFGPDRTLTRAEAVAVFARMLGRAGDTVTAGQMDDRFTFRDVPKSNWAYTVIMEAAVPHTFTGSGNTERWQTYWHSDSRTADWERSDSVANAARITNTITCEYTGDFTQNYNWDYSAGLKEWYVNSNHYASETDYLVWISLQNQKVYVFKGKENAWKLEKTFICGSGKPGTETRVGVTNITYRQAIWRFTYYICAPVVRFYPGTGFAFHSRLYKDEKKTKPYDKRIGYPVSHGCIRMLDADIEYIYNTVPDGSCVVVY